MLKPIKNLLERSALSISILITIGILCLSLVKVPQTGVQVAGLDKVLHTFAYFVLTLSWFFSIKKAHISFNTKLIIGLSVFILGMVIEVLQGSLTSYRQADYFDVLANTSGIVLATLLFSFLLRIFKSI